MIATFDSLEKRKAGPAAEPWRTTIFVDIIAHIMPTAMRRPFAR